MKGTGNLKNRQYFFHFIEYVHVHAVLFDIFGRRTRFGKCTFVVYSLGQRVLDYYSNVSYSKFSEFRHWFKDARHFS